jgi:hypothetical protein
VAQNNTAEMCIDFRDIVGEHSGDNMAEAVWTTLTNYGLEKGRVSIGIHIVYFYNDISAPRGYDGQRTNSDTMMVRLQVSIIC